MKPVSVQVLVVSSGKKSESHTFTYTPKGTYTPLAAATTLSSMHISMHNNNAGSTGGGAIVGGVCGSNSGGNTNSGGSLSTNQGIYFVYSLVLLFVLYIQHYYHLFVALCISRQVPYFTMRSTIGRSIRDLPIVRK